MVTFTQGGASLALGYLLTPLTGLCKEEGLYSDSWLVIPSGSLRPSALRSTRDIKGPRLVGSKMREPGFSDSKYRSDSFPFLALLAIKQMEVNRGCNIVATD